MKQPLFQSFVRWGLGVHGVIHIVETAANVYENAWISAGLSAFAAFLMMAGAFMDYDYHKKEGNK